MKTCELIATSTFGLEAFVKKEVMELGYDINSVENNKVFFTGDAEAIALCNIHLRCADRILIKMGEFKATTFTELFDKVNALPWEDWITPDAKFTVNGKSVKSGLYSVPDCQAITKKAIVKRLGEKYNMDHFPETGPAYTVEVSILKDIATLTIDTTGKESLHKRGYRVASVAAPLKETMAAALLKLSYWQKGRILYDPCCGSGTFAIEAALMAKNIAPGLYRNFACSTWPQIPKEMWNDLREEAKEMISTKGNPIIYASDVDRNAIAAAKQNAEAAGVANCIQFFTKAIHKATLPHGDYGVIITNPPYGERISDPVKTSKIHQDIKRLLDSNTTWSVYALTSVDTFEREFGKKADKKRKLFNGNLRVDFYQYFGPKPPKDGENFQVIKK